MTSLLVVSLLAVPQQALAAVELDRVVSTVQTTKIWSSDVRQARLLKLCGPTVASDEGILIELQNRVLILAEVGRAAGREPTAEELAAHRRAWEQTLGTAAVDPLMTRAGMSARDLQAWHRNDLRIQMYLDGRFGGLAPNQRATRTADWLGDLRQRAGLK